MLKRMSGGQRVDILENPNGGPAIYSHFYWTTPLATIDNAPTSALVAPVKHDNTVIYLQDRWQISAAFGLNIGVRWDRQEIFDRFGRRVIDLKDDYAPRLGFTWAPGAEGHSKLYGSFGQYYEQIPMDLVIRSFAQERQARIFNYDPLSTSPDAAAEFDLGRDSVILGGFTEEADPNLKNQYINEFMLGYEREIMPDVAVGVKRIYREYGRVIEDFVCTDAYDYCIGNPGKGIMQRIYTYDVSTTFPAPEPKREYKGLQLDATKRFSNNWQGLASYVYSKLDGNYDGEYAPFTNVGADPNISAAYDYYDFFTDGRNFDRITNDGPLSNDRRHQFKFSGYYITDFKLSIGVSGYYRTGTPLTKYGFSDGYNRYEFFLSKRGAEGRGAGHLRGRRAPRLSARGRAGDVQLPARHLQPSRRPAADPRRPAVGLPGGRQLLADAGQPRLRQGDPAHTADHGAGGGPAELLTAGRPSRIFRGLLAGALSLSALLLALACGRGTARRPAVPPPPRLAAGVPTGGALRALRRARRRRLAVPRAADGRGQDAEPRPPRARGEWGSAGHRAAAAVAALVDDDDDRALAARASDPRLRALQPRRLGVGSRSPATNGGCRRCGTSPPRPGVRSPSWGSGRRFRRTRPKACW